MTKYFNISIIIFLSILGCREDIGDLNDELDNSLDSQLVKCGLPALSIYPKITTIAENTTFTTDLFALDDADSGIYFGGAKAVVHYNPEILELTNIIDGDMAIGSSPLFFTNDSVDGRVEIIAVFVNPDSAGIDASKNLRIATLEFKSIGIGSDTLFFDRIENDSCIVESTSCELVDPNDQLVPIRGYEDSIVNVE